MYIGIPCQPAAAVAVYTYCGGNRRGRIAGRFASRLMIMSVLQQMHAPLLGCGISFLRLEVTVLPPSSTSFQHHQRPKSVPHRTTLRRRTRPSKSVFQFLLGLGHVHMPRHPSINPSIFECLMTVGWTDGSHRVFDWPGCMYKTRCGHEAWHGHIAACVLHVLVQPARPIEVISKNTSSLSN